MFGTDFNDTFEAKVNEQKRLKGADMLPAPKAGAAAPAKPAKPTEPEDPDADPTDPDNEGNEK
jgi:hypothetical protein